MALSSYNVDISNNVVPYINTCSQLGYFGSTLTSGFGFASWQSLPVNLLGNNMGICSIGSDNRSLILNKGVYKITLSVDILGLIASNLEGAVYFAFGPSAILTSTSGLTNGLGGNGSVYMRNIGNENSNTNPGILSWNVNTYNSGNTGSNFVLSNGYLVYQYNIETTATSVSGTIYYAIKPGLCTTELTFTVEQNDTSLYFNVSSAISDQSGVSMGTCYFTLELISSNSFY